MKVAKFYQNMRHAIQLNENMLMQNSAARHVCFLKTVTMAFLVFDTLLLAGSSSSLAEDPSDLEKFPAAPAAASKAAPS